MVEQNIRKDVWLSTVGGYFVAALNFIINIILIRFLSAELYGLFSFIVNQFRRVLRLLDFSFVELILISQKRNLKLSELTESYIFHSIIRILIVFFAGLITAWYTDNLKLLSVIAFLLVYTNVRYFYVFGITHFYEVYFNTKYAQFFYSISAVIFLSSVFLLPFFFETSLFNFALSLFIASIIVVLIISIKIFQKAGYKNTKLSSNVFNALKSHSIFLQIPVLAGLIIKFIQDTLIIVQQSSEVYALYSVALLIGSLAVVGARGAIRPLSPYVWSKEKNSIRPYIYIGIFMFAIGIFGSLFGNFFERIFLLVNDEYVGVSIYFSLGIVLAVSLAYSQLFTTFIKGVGLIKHFSIVASFMVFISFVLTLFAYYFFDREYFAINLLIIDIIVTISTILLLLCVYKFKIRIINE